MSIRPSLVLSPGDYANVVAGVQQRLVGPFPNCWSYVDVEDLADLVVLAGEASTLGHEVVYAAQPDNFMGRPFAELVRTAYGDDAPPLRALEREDAGGISIAKARRLLGWDPNRSWRERVESQPS